MDLYYEKSIIKLFWISHVLSEAVKMKFVGAHVSASGGVFNAPKNAVEIGAKAFALFTKNQRQWSAKALDNKTIDLWFKE